APDLEVEVRARFVGADDGRGQLVELAGDQPRPEVDADPGGIDAAIHQPGVGDGELRRRHGKLDVARHVLAALAQLLAALGQGVLLQVEVADLPGDVVRQPGDPERLESTHGPPALRQGCPDAVRTISQGRQQAQTGYDHTAFVTKHVRLVDRRRARSQWLSRPELFTRVEPPP